MSEHDTAPPAQETVDLAHALFDLARSGHAERLTTYVDAGAPVDLTDPAGNTLLMLAAYHGHAELVSQLAAAGADVAPVAAGPVVSPPEVVPVCVPSAPSSGAVVPSLAMPPPWAPPDPASSAARSAAQSAWAAGAASASAAPAANSRK